MFRIVKAVSVVFVAFATVVVPATAKAQGSGGRLSGVVRTGDGMPLPATRVSVTNAIGAARVTTTDAAGHYSFPSLGAGAYSVAAAHVGFLRAIRNDVTISGDVTVDFALDPLPLNAITVTATLREQRLSDVPFSIAAPTAALLRSQGADNIEDIASTQAGFSVQNLGPGQSQVAMRGTSSGQTARDQPGVKEEVGVYLDDAPISLSLFTPEIDLFDVSRVEVLRGPQGTLFGAGSLAGTVRYITNQPELGVSSVFGEVGGSTISGGTPGGDVKIGANVPLGFTAAARVVGYFNRYGGYMDAVQPDSVGVTNSTVHLARDVNASNRAGLRASVTLAPTARLTITPRAMYQGINADGWNRHDLYNVLANPFTTTRRPITLEDRQLFTQQPEPYNDRFGLGDVNAEYNLGAVKLTSVSSYNTRDVRVVRDGGALYASIVGATIGLPEPVYTMNAQLTDITHTHVFSQELRLSGDNGAGRHWLVGGFFSNGHRGYGQSVLTPGFTAATGIPTQGLRAATDQLFYSDLAYTLKQFAVFGEGTVPVTPRADLTAGIRYYNFNEDRTQIFDGFFGNNDNGNSLLSQPGKTKANGIAPRLMASYKLTDNVRLNAQASKGFRLGGINDPLNYPVCTPQDSATFGGRDSWKDETAWNYEVGTKSTFMGGRASMNVSAYYMDIQNLQLTVTAGTCTSRLVFNVPKAQTSGLEFELGATPSEHWDFSVNASVNNGKLKSTITSTDTTGGTPTVSVVSGIKSGNRLPSVPQLQGAVAGTYRWKLVRGALPFVSTSVRYVGSRYTLIDDLAQGFGTVPLNPFGNTIGDPQPANGTFTFNPQLKAYTLANARVGFTRGVWEYALFVNNIMNEEAQLALDRERGTLARVGFLTNPPRTFGVVASFNQ